MQCLRKRKAPVAGSFNQMVRRIGFRASAARDPHWLRPPAGARPRAKTLRVFFTPAPRPRFESMQCLRKESPLPGALISNGAAYRIRTYDVLIRSQTSIQLEVTPRLVDYYAYGLNIGRRFSKKVIEFDFYSFEHLARSSTHRDIRKSRCRELQDQLVRRIDSAHPLRDPRRLRPPAGVFRCSLKRSAFSLTLALDRGSNLRNAPIYKKSPRCREL